MEQIAGQTLRVQSLKKGRPKQICRSHPCFTITVTDFQKIGGVSGENGHDFIDQTSRK